MNDIGFYETEPEKYDGNDKDYIWGVCECAIDISYRLKIPRSFSNNGWYPFKCKNCGIKGLLFGGKNGEKIDIIDDEREKL